MNPKKSDLKPNQEFSGSAGKSKKLPKDTSVKPTQDFSGSAGKGGLPKGNC